MGWFQWIGILRNESKLDIVPKTGDFHISNQETRFPPEKKLFLLMMIFLFMVI